MSGAGRRWAGWPTVLLVAGLAATAAAAVQAYRAVVSERALAERALRDYAGFAAWSYRLHVRDALRANVEKVLGPVNHGDALHIGAGLPSAQSLVHYMPWDPECYCHTPPDLSPAAFLGFTLGADTLAVGLNHYPQPARGWLVDTLEARLHGPAELSRALVGEVPAQAEYAMDAARAVNALISARVRSDWPTDWGYGLIIAEVLGTRRYIAYRPMARTVGDTIVYAVEYAPQAIGVFLTEVMESETLLPDVFTQPAALHGNGSARKRNRWLLDIEVQDGGGATLFASDTVDGWALDARTALPASFAGIGVRAQIRAEAADAVLAGGLPRSRLPFLIGLLVLAAALSMVAVGQLRREAELARTRSDFVSSVSHELRTPLAQIRLFIETLRLNRARTERDRTWSLDNLERETTRLTHLVENVLQFGRITHGTAEADAAVEVPAIDVVAEVRSAVDGFVPLAGARATFDVAAHGPARARVDADALRQVLLNLLDNAVKYGPRGQRVRVEVVCDAAHVTIAVSDEGAGVPSRDRARIWEPFERGRNGATQAVGGSGIGLTIVRDVAHRFGGTVACETAEGGGARFVLRLPAVRTPAAQA